VRIYLAAAWPTRFTETLPTLFFVVIALEMLNGTDVLKEA